jgi:hypothetical protein
MHTRDSISLAADRANLHQCLCLLRRRRPPLRRPHGREAARNTALSKSSNRLAAHELFWNILKLTSGVLKDEESQEVYTIRFTLDYLITVRGKSRSPVWEDLVWAPRELWQYFNCRRSFVDSVCRRFQPGKRVFGVPDRQWRI